MLPAEGPGAACRGATAVAMGPEPPWATAAAVGPGREGRGDRLRWGHIRILYKAPTDYTKPQQTIQSPDRQYNAPKRLYKDPDILDKDPTIRQRPKMFDKSCNKY